MYHCYVHALTKCDRICKNWSKSHRNWNPFYCWTLKLNSCTNLLRLTHGHRWPSLDLLSQTAFCQPCHHQGALQDIWGQWMALIRMWVTPDCCQWLSRLIPWIESVSVTKCAIWISFPKASHKFQECCLQINIACIATLKLIMSIIHAVFFYI